MPPSQLKQLKASLRENGITSSQKPKKQRKTDNKDAQRRNQRNAALEGIRERFNPFEAKAPARREKFEIASNKPTKKTVERPGVTRGLGEERRRETLLKEMQRRNKVGGLLDRRFGEDDPNMTPEQKAAERFAQQALRTNKKTSMFNLEEDSEDELKLTHGGRALVLDNDTTRDDFDETFSASDADDFDAQDDRIRKRARIEDNDADAQIEDDAPLRKKSKHEVMQEVIAKSKAYKAARQATKEDDDDLRMELNKGMSDLFSALQGTTAPPRQLPSPPATDSEPALDPSRAAMLAGKSREDAEKEYEANLRHLKLEARSKPSVRTKSGEEKAAEEKARLEDLERKRVRRMKGEIDTSDEESENGGSEQDEEVDDAEAFGLEQPVPQARYIPQLEVEDEDQFVFDDILASDSEAELDSNGSDDDDDDSSIPGQPEDDGDDDFINGLVLPKPSSSIKPSRSRNLEPLRSLPFTFPCPQNHDELIGAMHDVVAEDLSTVVQRIRALYHKGLAQPNEAKLGKFAQSLIPWIAGLVNGRCKQQPSMEQVEQLLRHLHSMAKSQPGEVAIGYRHYFRNLSHQDSNKLDAGDLIVLTSVSTVYPTSDQWHSVVTPAMSLLARYVGQAPMDELIELVKATFACSLLLRFQRVSQRYVPEAVNLICKGLQLLTPSDEHPISQIMMTPEIAESDTYQQTRSNEEVASTRLSFEGLRNLSSAFQSSLPSSLTSESLILALINLVKVCIKLHSSKSAYPELMAPIQAILAARVSAGRSRLSLSLQTFTTMSETSSLLNASIEASIAHRKPLLLHTHRPLAIKSSYPAFMDNYNPERRYKDPDRERAELNKLKAEHKKERKGAMRELRKDANFMAREQLREKKAKDEAYEKKFKRLVAEIQGEEGREAKDYEREKAKRTGRF